MANQRAKDQQLLPFAAKRQFVSEMDAGLKAIGCGNRSQFIRDAIREKLARVGVQIPADVSAAPARTKSLPPEASEKSNSTPVDPEKVAVDFATVLVKRIRAKRKAT